MNAFGQLDFVPFPKIARLSRDCVVTEKIDGTNAQIHIRLESDPDTGAVRERLEFGVDTQIELPEGVAFIRGGSRSRWLGQGGATDNFGFGRLVTNNAHELVRLGAGSHFGEWWGSGVQRGYGLERGEKRFSLFNTHRWSDDAVRPTCCGVVPVLISGPFRTDAIDVVIDLLREQGSVVAPGFMDPEGVVIYHTAANLYFKKTLKKDEEPKGFVKASEAA